jgi:hypothetical protein
LLLTDWIASTTLTTNGTPDHYDYSGWTWSAGPGASGGGGGGGDELSIDVLPTMTAEQGAQIAAAILGLWALAWALRLIRESTGY